MPAEIMPRVVLVVDVVGVSPFFIPLVSLMVKGRCGEQVLQNPDCSIRRLISRRPGFLLTFTPRRLNPYNQMLPMVVSGSDETHDEAGWISPIEPSAGA